MLTVGRLLVITGPPGAGKSAVASIIGERLTLSAVVTGDSFFGFLADGKVEPWMPAAHAQNETVIKAAAAASARFVRDGFQTVFDGVVGPWFLPAFADAAGLESLDYVILMPPVDVCLARVRHRRDHGFADESATRHMHSDFANTEIDARHVIDSADATAHETAELVLRARQSGALSYTGHRTSR